MTELNRFYGTLQPSQPYLVHLLDGDKERLASSNLDKVSLSDSKGFDYVDATIPKGFPTIIS